VGKLTVAWVTDRAYDKQNGAQRVQRSVRVWRFQDLRLPDGERAVSE
jgi:hypothetical protein